MFFSSVSAEEGNWRGRDEKRDREKRVRGSEKTKGTYAINCQVIPLKAGGIPLWIARDNSFAIVSITFRRKVGHRREGGRGSYWLARLLKKIKM